MSKTVLKRIFIFTTLAVLLGFVLPGAVTARPEDACNLLDDPSARGLMSGAFETKLLVECGRQSELGGVKQEAVSLPANLGVDVLVNDPSGDTGSSRTQSETSLAISDSGILCSGYNDSYHGVTQGTGYTGFSSSADGGATWVDHGPIGSSSFGDPAVAWRKVNDTFYIATLHSSGLGLYNLGSACDTVTYVGNIHVGSGDDKELMAVDNNPASPYYGRLYVAWTNFGAGARIYVTYSDNTTTWSAPVAVSGVGIDVQGAWPAVDPNTGDVYVAWVRWNPYSTGPIDIEVVRSTNGGASFTQVTNPLTGAVNPRDAAATSSCGRPALNGNIRYLPSPQIVVDQNSNLHVVYSYDPDGYNTGDVVNVFYRRSADNGTSWGPEVQLNDDVTTQDQFFPALTVSPSGVVGAYWYDRRLDAGNYLFDYYGAVSYDNGVTFSVNTRVSDVSSPVVLDPNLATCYHGDYDTSTSDLGQMYIQWSDDRGGTPDVYLDTQPLFPDFSLDATPAAQDVCAPADAVYDVDVGSVQGFSDDVTLSTQGEPAGTLTNFSVNPVTPPGTSVLTVSNTGAAAAGSYMIDIIGVAPTSTHTTTVGLNLFDTIPGAVTLLSPADGAVDVPLVPTYDWNAAAQGSTYNLEVATDSGFTNIVYTATVGTTSHISGVALNPITTYYWHVAAENACGAGTFSATFSFTTQDIPPVLLVDDDDNAPDVQSTYTAALNNLLGAGNYDIWDTNNSDNEPTVTDLAPYSMVIWFTGDEFGGFAGPGAAGEAALGTWLDGGNCLFISSQDYHWDRGTTPFMTNYLGVGSVSNDTGNYTSVTGQGSVFGGLGPYSLSYPFTDYSDIVNPGASAELAFDGDNGNDAAINKDSGVYRTTFWGYPWEAISGALEREEAMLTALSWCGTGAATGTLQGTVTSLDYGLPIDGADILADNGVQQFTATTNASGDYVRQLPIGTYTVTASATNYLSQTVSGVVILTGTVTVQDFALQGPYLTYSPDSLQVTLDIGSNTTLPLTLTNTGAAQLDFEFVEQDLGYVPPPVIPYNGLIELDVDASYGPAPTSGAPNSSVAAPFVPLGSIGYSVNAAFDNFINFDLDVPEVLNTIAPFAPPNFPGAGEYVGDYVYVIEGTSMHELDPVTGADLGITPVTPPGGAQSYTGMALDPTDGMVYLASCDITTSILWTLDMDTGTATQIGTITNSPCTIGVAIDGNGDLWGYDIVNDSFMFIDKTTAAGTIIGPLGFDANFGQGIGWDAATDNIYLVAFNNGTFQSELRIADRATGNTTFVGVLGQTVPGGTSQLAFLGLPLGVGGDIPWLSEDPISGTLPADTGQLVADITFDAGVPEINQPGEYYGILKVISNDPVNSSIPIPVTLTVNIPDTYGMLEGTVTSLGYCDANPAPLFEETVVIESSTGMTFEAVTDDNGGYSYWLEETGSPYTVTVVAVEHTSGFADDVFIVGGETTTVDFDLRWLAPCVSADPDIFDVTVGLGYSTTEVLELLNTGAKETYFELEEQNGGYVPPPLVPYNGPIELDTDASFGPAPNTGEPAAIGAAPFVPLGSIGYSVNAAGGTFVNLDVDVPEVLNTIAAFAPANFPGAGEYVGDYVYVIEGTSMHELDPVTGADLGTTPVTPPGGSQSYTGMALDPTDGTVYLASCDIASSILWTLDMDTGTATQIGTITNSPCMIGIAIDGNGDMWGHDIVNDSFMFIDKTTAAGTIIGPLGWDANFGQGAGWDAATDTLYLAAFNATTFQPELRIVDRTNGNNTLVGVLGQSVPGGLTQEPFLGLPIDVGGGDIPWLSEDPVTGMIGADSNSYVDLIFDASVLTQTGDYTGMLQVMSDDQMSPIDIQLTLHVVEAYAPDVSFTVSPTLLVDTPATFTNTSDPGLPPADEFLWDFGDGNTLTAGLEDVTHVYSDTGTFTVTLYAENGVGSDTATMVVNVVAEADLSIAKAASPDPVGTGEDLEYTLTVSNLGPTVAMNVVVIDTLPAGVTFVSASTGCTESAGVVTCDMGDLANGASVDLSIMVTAPDAPGTITNMAEVMSDADDPDTTNNTVSLDTTVELSLYMLYQPIISRND